MSTHENRPTRLVKADRVRRSAEPVPIGSDGEDRTDATPSTDGPSVRAEKDENGRVVAVLVTCSCGETIRVNCHYSGDEDHETAQP